MVETSCLDCGKEIEQNSQKVCIWVYERDERKSEYAHPDCLSEGDVYCIKDHEMFLQTQKGIGICPSC